VNTVRFGVDEVFDLPTRSGLLVVGIFIDGQPVCIPSFRDTTTTGHPLTVIGVEFATARTLRTGQTTFLLDRADEQYANAGREWSAEVGTGAELHG